MNTKERLMNSGFTHGILCVPHNHPEWKYVCSHPASRCDIYARASRCARGEPRVMVITVDNGNCENMITIDSPTELFMMARYNHPEYQGAGRAMLLFMACIGWSRPLDLAGVLS